MLATLDDKLAKLARQAGEDKAAKEAYDKAYHAALGSVQEKQKEVKLVNRPVNTLKSGPTAAGLALMERRKGQERQAAEEREAKGRERRGGDDMDVDDENGKGKTRRCVCPVARTVGADSCSEAVRKAMQPSRGSATGPNDVFASFLSLCSLCMLLCMIRCTALSITFCFLDHTD